MLDDLDRRIVERLIADGRLSYRALGDGVPRRTPRDPRPVAPGHRESWGSTGP